MPSRSSSSNAAPGGKRSVKPSRGHAASSAAAAQRNQGAEEELRFIFGLSAKQVGMLIFAVCLLAAAAFDLTSYYMHGPKNTSEVMLSSLYDLASQLPPGGAPYRNVEEIGNVAKLAREAADELEDLDADGQPQVASSATVVCRDAALSLSTILSSDETDSLEHCIRAAMAVSDIALHANADEPHVALLLVAATASRRLATLSMPEGEHTHAPPDSKSFQILLRRAALLEQAIAVQAERPALRVMYASALIGLQRYDDGRRQLERVLRKHQAVGDLRRWVEWLDALAVEHGTGGEYDAAEALRSFARETPHPQSPVESFFDQLHFALIDSDVLSQLTPP